MRGRPRRRRFAAAAAAAAIGAMGAAVAFGAVVDEAPISSIEGPSPGLGAPHGVGVDSAGRVYVANQHSDLRVFAAGASGSAAPIAVVPTPAGTNTPLGVFVNTDDHVWVAYNSGHVAEFGPNPGAASVPLRVLNVGEAGAYNSIRGVVVDSAGRIYTADCDSGIIKVFAANASGTPTPIRDIRGPNTMLGPSYGLAGSAGTGQSWGIDVDGDGNLLVAGGSRVLKFSPTANGDVAPIATINSSAPAFSYAIEVEVLASGNVYVVDRGLPAVYIFSSSALASGSDVDTPLKVIRGAATLLASPVGVAVAPNGTIVVGDTGWDAIRRYAAYEAGGRPVPTPTSPSTDSDRPADGSTAAPAAERPRTGVSIDCGARFTEKPAVVLCIQPPEGAERMVVSNDGGFTGTTAVPVARRSAWSLDSTGPTRLPKTVYVRFEGPGVNREVTYSDDIILDETKPEVVFAELMPTAGESARASRPVRHVLRVRARDSQSAIARLRIAVGNRALPPQDFANRVVLATRLKEVRVRVRDRAGNWSGWRAASLR
jgi:hypothetical protein